MPGQSPSESRNGFTRPWPRGQGWLGRSLVWMAAVSLLAGVVLVQMGDNGIIAWRRLRTQEAQLRLEVEAMTRDNAKLVRDIDDLAHDKETLERHAREVAGMIRPGEEVLFVRPAADRTGD